jgi:cystathionine beta-lyase/cystathionine gamma-synthase
MFEKHGRARRRGRTRDRDWHGCGHYRVVWGSRAGDRVVASKALFGSCRYVVEEHRNRYGLRPRRRRHDLALEDRGAAQHQDVLPESPTNPTLEVLDIKAIADIAHAAGATLVVDNVFATPLYQRPLELGADCVVYSATKHIDGQGRCLGGVVLGSEKFIQDHIHTLIRQTGPSLSPFNAWVMLKGLETLPVRVQRQTETAAAVAATLASIRRSRASFIRAGPITLRPRLFGGRCRPAQTWSHSRSKARKPAPSASRTRSSSSRSATISATPRA